MISDNGNGKGITIEAAFDKQIVSDRGKSTRHLVVDIKAPDTVHKNAGQKPALNIALVIDASASMGGKRLESAKESVIGVMHSLTENDRLSIISFASEMHLHVDGIKLDAAGRKKAIASVEDLRCRDNTNLGGGWMKGAECVAKVMQKNDKMHNHVIILSDGHANVGLTNPIVLEHHAEQLRQRRVLTSCVGIGNDYSSAQLQSLADYGGGRLHDAEHPGEIIEVVLGELRELQGTVVEDISVTVAFPASTRVETISGFPTVMASSSILCQMGSLSPGGTRSVIFRVNAGEGSEGDQLQFDISSNWLWTGTDKRDKAKGDSQILQVAGAVRNANQSRNLDLCLRVAEIWQSNIVRKAVRLNREKKLNDLSKYLDLELRYFARYCDEVPETDELVAALEQMRVVADREWNERSRKSMEYTTYLTQTSQIDHRTLDRGGWWKFLDEHQAKQQK